MESSGSEGVGVDLEELAATYRAPLVGFILRRVRDLDLAEDLTQDVLLRVAESIDRLDPDRPVWPWIATVARRRIIDHARRASTAARGEADIRVAEALGQARGDDADTGSQMAERVHQRQLIDQALRGLSREQRSALLLHDMADWSADRISATHERQRDAVYQLLHRARRHARREYERLDGAGRVGGFAWPPLLWLGVQWRRLRGQLAAGAETLTAGVLAPLTGVAALATLVLGGVAVTGHPAGGTETPAVSSPGQVAEARHGAESRAARDRGEPDTEPGEARPTPTAAHERDAGVELGRSLDGAAEVEVSIGPSDRSERGTAVARETQLEPMGVDLATSRGELHLDCTRQDAAALCEAGERLRGDGEHADPPASHGTETTYDDRTEIGLAEDGPDELLDDVDVRTQDNCGLLADLPGCDTGDDPA